MIKPILTLLIFSGMMLPTASAHKNSDSYLRIDATAAPLSVQWSIAIRDIDIALPLDGDADGNVTWGELQSQQAAVYAWAFANLQLQQGNNPCSFTPGELLVDTLSDGEYAVLRFPANCTSDGDYQIDYHLLFEYDPNHRGLLNLQLPNGSQQSVLSPTEPSATLALSGGNKATTAARFFREGVWHIWIGFDHLLFLFTLLLPAVLVYRQQQWQASESLGHSIKSIAAIVTAFTVAHSLTLSAAALGWLSLPSRWVEAAIAASIVVAALNNLKPLILKRLWLLAFVLGLIHGFGFAGVLADLGLEAGNLLLPLFTFNLGVEAGQLAVVAVLMPLAWWLRRTVFYRRAILIGGSILAALIGAYWCLERLA